MSPSEGTSQRGERDGAARDEAKKAKPGFKDPGDRSNKLFDLRFLIGGLFTLYGLMVGGAGLFDSATDLHKSGGMRINLWTGIGMLCLGLLFLLWAVMRPVQHGDGAGDE